MAMYNPNKVSDAEKKWNLLPYEEQQKRINDSYLNPTGTTTPQPTNNGYGKITNMTLPQPSSVTSFGLGGSNNQVLSPVGTSAVLKPQAPPPQIGQTPPPPPQVGQAQGQVNGQTQPQPQTNDGTYDPTKSAEEAKTRAINQANTSYDQQTKMLEEKKAQDLARLKSILDSRTSQINSNISGARNKYQPQREQVDVRRAQDLQRARELLAAQGIMGGDNLTTQMNINTSASDQMTGIDQAQQDYVKNLEDESRQLQYAYDADTAQAISRSYDEQRKLLDDKTSSIVNAENLFATNLQNAYKAKQEREDKMKKEEQDRRDSSMLLQGKTFDPVSGEYVNTASQNEVERKIADEKETDRINKYLATIGQFSNNYQERINQILGDGDPSNDWEVPYLKTAQADKKANMFQNEVKSIGQYSNDYQAEIDRRTKTLDGEDDKLIPYLKQAQTEKKSNIQKSQADAIKEARESAMKIFEKTGIATKEIASILGIPEGTTTDNYRKTQYDISKPYYKPESASGSAQGVQTKQSPYLNTVIKQLDGLMGDYADRTYDGKTLSSLVTKQGTAEHKQFVTSVNDAILSGMITPSEGEMLFNTYGIPK